MIEDAVGHLAKSTTDSYLDHGVLGLTALMFMAMFWVMFYYDRKDKTSQGDTADALHKMADSQARVITMFENSTQRNEQVVELLTGVLNIERGNTKECYKEVVNNQKNIDTKLNQILQIVGTHA